MSGKVLTGALEGKVVMDQGACIHRAAHTGPNKGR